MSKSWVPTWPVDEFHRHRDSFVKCFIKSKSKHAPTVRHLMRPCKRNHHKLNYTILIKNKLMKNRWKGWEKNKAPDTHAFFCQNILLCFSTVRKKCIFYRFKFVYTNLHWYSQSIWFFTVNHFKIKVKSQIQKPDIWWWRNSKSLHKSKTALQKSSWLIW